MTYKTSHQTTIAKATILALAAALLSLAVVSSALAGPPAHPRKASLDIAGLNKACGAAVDSKGDVYASSAGEDKIKVFDPDHDLLTTLENTNEPCALGVTTRGELLVSEQGTGNVVMYVPDAYPLSATPTYAPAITIDSSGDARGIAVDRTDNRLYVAKGDHVDVYNSERQQLDIFSATGGTYKLRFEGQETAPLAFNATAAQVQAALEALSTIGAGNVAVTGNVTGSGSTISFLGELAFTNVPQVEAVSSLTGNETQQVTVNATAGTYRLLFAGEQTAPIAFNASAAELEAALEALTAFVPADVSVLGGPGGAGGTTPYGVTFAGAYANTDVPPLWGDASALTGTVNPQTISQVQTVTVNATAGSYKLKFEGEETGALAFNASVGAVQTALEALAKIAPGDVTVSGGPGGPGGTTPYVVDFKGAFGGKSVPQMGSNVTGLTGAVSVAAIAGGPIVNVAPSASGGLGVDETQQILTSASGGSFKLKFEGEETTPIAFNASAAEVQTALEALGNIAPGDVSVTRNGSFYMVGFEGAYAATDVPQITVTSALTPNEVQKLTVNATAGAYKLKFEGEETAAILFSASAAEVQATLEALAKIAPGDITVSAGPGGPGGATPYLVGFEGAFAGKNVNQMTSAKSGLVGSATVVTALEGTSASASTATPGSGPLLEDPLADYTGVAAYTYIFTGNNPAILANLKRHYYLTVADAATDEVKVFTAKEGSPLKLRRTISDVDHDENPSTPDQSFAFGSAGAYLVADPGNESRATRGCIQVQIAGEDQACTGGHFFFYDAANEALDEFEATGELVGQKTSAAFADAGPSALAVDRSGTADDGTIYVGAGAGPDAKLVAFGPLTMPGREPVPALSHVLTGAKAVATDCEGYVYVAAESSIRVFSPTGVELTSFTDANKAVDLAADCSGNVYVIDDKTDELTYYTPAQYPPEASTTYIRHTPPLIPAGSLSGNGMVGVAVNPANDHVFVVGDSAFVPNILELGSAAEESQVVGECGAGLAGFVTARLDIGVYGKSGHVYVTANPTQLYVLSCGKEAKDGELIRVIKGGGCPSSEFGPSPVIAVDQSNGHILEFEPGQPGGNAREYDSSGACVAEFGTFANAPAHQVAIDNSCALHDPPLSGQTTPTCAEAYPANGTTYVAADGIDNGVQPYDVSAFGPLEYPPPVEEGEKPQAQTGAVDGFGPGAITLRGSVNPRGSLLEACSFEYLSKAKYDENGETFAGAEEIPCAESPEAIGNGSSPVAVHADLEAIQVGVPYRYRLLASNEFGSGEGDTEAFALSPPAVETKSALPVGYDEATLRGEIDPSGIASEYHFEYLTQAAYEENGGTFAGAQSTPKAELAASEGFFAVQAPITGLNEGTVYRFRLLAENAVGAASEEGPTFEALTRSTAQDCENAEYRVGLGAFLPDCRAYELVTPAQTLSSPGTFSTTAGLRFFNSWFVAPRGPGAGESVAFRGDVARVDGEFFRAQRGAGAHPAGGWQSEVHGLSFIQSAGGSEHAQGGVSSDQRYQLHEVQVHLVPTDQAFPVGDYMRVAAGQANRECAPEPKATFVHSDPEAKFELVGCGSLGTDSEAEGRFISAGGTHVIFTSEEELEEGSPAAGVEAIYDREAGEASAELISVKPDGTPFEAGEEPTYVATTEDGTGVVFKAAGTLYLHRGGKTTTVAQGSTYAGISEDGKRVFFIDATFTPSNENPMIAAGLRACDVEAGDCAGPGQDQEPVEIAENSVFVNVSSDGSHVFFLSEDALTGAEANENGEEAQASEPNLYAWDGTAVSFIAIAHPQDLAGFHRDGGDEEFKEDLSQWTNAIPGQRSTGGEFSEIGRSYSPTRSTPDGGAFAFQSHAQLTAYDNDEKGEIYRYAPSAPLGSQLSCVSCDPSGAPHDSPADALFQTAQGKAVTPDTLIPNLTDDGKRVVFESREALLTEDANEGTDVYVWKAPGTEGPGGDTCSRPGGCLALISSGQSEESSYLFGMSADGSDVFFVTREVLAAADVSGSFSIYDARILGGIPDPPLAAPCEGDACQGRGSAPPSLPAAATTGAGNGNEQAQSKSCAKGKRRVKGRCVKKKHAKKKQKHAKKQRANHDRRASR